jgi:hypothetical protein
VGLWEQAFKLPARYPRISARKATAAPLQIQIESRPKSPWSVWSLPEALRQVEAGARLRGLSGARFPSWVKELDVLTQQLKHWLPADLHAFYAWYDSTLWNRFVQPSSASSPMIADSADSADPVSQWLAQPEQVHKQVRIRPPSDIRIATLRESAAFRADTRAFADSLASLDQPSTWLNTQLIEFADSDCGATIFYCTDPPNLPRGCIVTFGRSDHDRIWLGDSLSEWLIRIAACNGIDAILNPALANDLDPALRQCVEADDRAHNKLVAMAIKMR